MESPEKDLVPLSAGHGKDTHTQPQLEVPPRLPREIQYSIVDLCISEYLSHAAEPFSYKYAPAVLNLLLVCRSWCRFGRSRIYKRVHFSSPAFYFRFARHIASGKGAEIRKLVKEVVLQLGDTLNDTRVVESDVIKTVFRFCRRIRKVDLRCDLQSLVKKGADLLDWHERLALAFFVYANPVWFIYNDPSSTSVLHAQHLVATDLFSYMPNLQRLDLYISPNPARLAEQLSALAVPHMNLRIHLSNNDLGDVEYESHHVLRPCDFFKVVATNKHLKKLEIVHRRWNPERTADRKSIWEDAIRDWIRERDSRSIPQVTLVSEYFGARPPQQKQKQPKFNLRWMKEIKDANSTNTSANLAHESDEDPGDSDWEEDTRLPVRVSNRAALAASTPSAMGFVIAEE